MINGSSTTIHWRYATGDGRLTAHDPLHSSGYFSPVLALLKSSRYFFKVTNKIVEPGTEGFAGRNVGIDSKVLRGFDFQSASPFHNYMLSIFSTKVLT